MSQHATLRASDQDREHVADRLRHATAEGRLLAEELEERLGAAFSARTYGELDAVVADLPARRLERRERASVAYWAPRLLALALVGAVVLALLAIVVIVVTGLIAGWLLWAAVAWWFIGRRHHGCHRGRPYPPRRISGRYGPI